MACIFVNRAFTALKESRVSDSPDDPTLVVSGVAEAVKAYFHLYFGLSK